KSWEECDVAPSYWDEITINDWNSFLNENGLLDNWINYIQKSKEI
ncbi:18873_t:CDS:1, partial [Rhizophagus irregularis]